MNILWSNFVVLIVLLISNGTALAMQKFRPPLIGQYELNTALWHACKNIENPETWSETIKAKLHCKSVADCRFLEVQKLIKAGANPNAVQLHKINNNLRGLTPLHWALANSNAPLVALLLNNGADANLPIKYATKYEHKTPLEIVDFGPFRSETARPKVLEALRLRPHIGSMLLKKGAKPDEFQKNFVDLCLGKIY